MQGGEGVDLRTRAKVTQAAAARSQSARLRAGTSAEDLARLQSQYAGRQECRQQRPSSAKQLQDERRRKAELLAFIEREARVHEINQQRFSEWLERKKQEEAAHRRRFLADFCKSNPHKTKRANSLAHDPCVARLRIQAMEAALQALLVRSKAVCQDAYTHPAS